MNKRKKIFFVIIALGLGSVLAFGMIEIGFRFLGGGESYSKYVKTIKRPVRVDEKLGLIFKPYKMTIHSNGIDYYVKEKTNRYGFLDRDYSPVKPRDTFRILMIGDSFVEAAQVPIMEKFHVLLEEKLNREHLAKRVQTMALGFSGMGTVNELAFYEHLGRQLKPDLVFLFFISNDYHNNSPTLHAINEGWHPFKGPRFFYEVQHQKDNKLLGVPVTTDYTNHFLFVTKPKSREKSYMLDPLFKWSEFYPFVKSKVELAFAKSDQEIFVEDSLYKQRIDLLRKTTFFGEKLEGWKYPHDLNLMSMYLAEDMPLVFRESLRLTEESLNLMRRMVQGDGAHFTVVGGHYLKLEKVKNSFGRKLIDEGLYKRLKQITDKYKLDLIDLHQAFTERGSIEEAKWKQDSHWSKKAHQWVAEALYEYIILKKFIPYKNKVDE